MSFKAPLERRRSRLIVSWRMLLDPPQLSRGLSVGLCVINVILPGVGTMITGMISDSMDTFLVGALQLISAIFVLGWVWSVAWGVELVRRSVRRGIGADNTGMVDEDGGETGVGWGTDISRQEAHASTEEGRHASGTARPDAV